MENKIFLDFKNFDKTKLVEEQEKYSVALKNSLYFSAMHNVDSRTLITFLLMFIGGIFLNFKLENIVLTWMCLQLALTVLSKLAQLGAAIEVKRAQQRLEKLIENACQQKEKDV